jgi:hypothetical protein
MVDRLPSERGVVGTDPVRIFMACLSTSLMSLLHIREYLRLPPAREYLAWNCTGGQKWMTSFMHEVAENSGFDGVLDMRDFDSFKPRCEGPFRWPIELARRLRNDVRTVHRWEQTNGIKRTGHIELWTEDPIHFDTQFSIAAWADAAQIKYPHCLYQEHGMTALVMTDMMKRWTDQTFARRTLYGSWVRLTSGLDLARPPRYDRAYTFDSPSPWAEESIDLSRLISLDAFFSTYRRLPLSVRNDVEAQIAPIKAGGARTVVLLLMGLNQTLRQLYQSAIERLLLERQSELSDCRFVVKAHPSAFGPDEEALFAWMAERLPGRFFPIRTGLNLEFILPLLSPEFVIAGPCGILPVLRKLRSPRGITLPEIRAYYEPLYATAKPVYDAMLRGTEVW